MYKEDMKKISAKRLKSAGIVIKARDIEHVKILKVSSIGNIYNYPATDYIVRLRNGSVLKYRWEPAGSLTKDHICKTIK